MRTGRASFWAGAALGVTTGAAAVYVGLRVWADYWPISEASLEGLDLDDTWDTDDPEERDLHGEPEFAPEPEIWCPGVDYTRVIPDLPTIRTWEPCTATIRHNAHVRWDRRQPATPGKLAQCDREHPHPVHIHSGGICRGIPTAGEVSDGGGA